MSEAGGLPSSQTPAHLGCPTGTSDRGSTAQVLTRRSSDIGWNIWLNGGWRSRGKTRKVEAASSCGAGTQRRWLPKREGTTKWEARWGWHHNSNLRLDDGVVGSAARSSGKGRREDLRNGQQQKASGKGRRENRRHNAEARDRHNATARGQRERAKTKMSKIQDLVKTSILLLIRSR